MIEEQHPMHMGLFPVDMKYQTTPQQQQQQTKTMLASGNERMLTTSIVTTATTTTATTTGTATTTKADNDTKKEGAIIQHGTTTTTTTENNLSTDILSTSTSASKVGSTLLMLTNVNGYVNNHNTNQNNNNNSNNNSHNHESNENCENNKTSLCNNEICNKTSKNLNMNENNYNSNNNNNNNNHSKNSSGPGPPVNQLILTNLRNTCASNVGRTFSDNNNNNNNNNNNDFYDNRFHNADLMSQALHHCDELQQQQQQQMLPQLQQQQQQNRLISQRHQQHINTNNRITALFIGKNSQITHCAFCCQPINDRYIMRVMDTYFHETCLKCANCSLHLVHSCFARDGKLYCRIDYEQLFLRNRCLGCGHNIAADELVMRTLENVFHLKCFACVVCGTLLKKGEQYVVKQGQLFCRFDYEKEVEMLQGYDFYPDDLFPPKMDGRRGPKRPRTILNTQQRRAFKASFELSPKPCRKIRENLAKETGLSLRIVQVWFQNQRAKVKKIQKKAKTEPVKGNSDSQDSQESDTSLTKVKDEAHSDNESLLESPYSTCANFFNCNETAEKLPCIKKELETTDFNCVETNKENCNKTNEPILNSILGLSYATFQQLMAPFSQSSMVNPIDRLYSMQNSYFRPDDIGLEDFEKAANNV